MSSVYNAPNILVQFFGKKVQPICEYIWYMKFLWVTVISQKSPGDVTLPCKVSNIKITAFFKHKVHEILHFMMSSLTF